MIGILLFSAVAALLVFVAGCGDRARDPRLTVIALVLLMVFPLSVLLPKAGVMPVPVIGGGDSGFPWQAVILTLWSLGFLIAAIRLGLAARGISHWRKRSVRVGQVENVEIRQLDGLMGPVAAGVLRPVIFVPADWENWSAETRRMVLEHELAHHRRRDPLWRWIAEIACAVHGCNPLVLWISRRLAMQCEFACDDRVLENGIRPGAYARLLCDCAQERAPAGPVLAMAVTSSLESRVRRLMKPRKNRGSATIMVLIGVAFAVAGVLATMGPSVQGGGPVSADEVDLRWSANPFPGEK